MATAHINTNILLNIKFELINFYQLKFMYYKYIMKMIYSDINEYK